MWEVRGKGERKVGLLGGNDGERGSGERRLNEDRDSRTLPLLIVLAIATSVHTPVA
jgi:hypothetical protein